MVSKMFPNMFVKFPKISYQNLKSQQGFPRTVSTLVNCCILHIVQLIIEYPPSTAPRRKPPALDGSKAPTFLLVDSLRRLGKCMCFRVFKFNLIRQNAFNSPLVFFSIRLYPYPENE